jgi:hypothetical protein
MSTLLGVPVFPTIDAVPAPVIDFNLIFSAKVPSATFIVALYMLRSSAATVSTAFWIVRNAVPLVSPTLLSEPVVAT